MIKILAGYSLKIDVDVTNEGLFHVVIEVIGGSFICYSIMLDKGATEELIRELQLRLGEL